MGGCMSEGMLPVFILKGSDFEFAVLIEFITDVYSLPIDTSCHGGTSKS